LRPDLMIMLWSEIRSVLQNNAPINQSLNTSYAFWISGLP